MSLVSKMRASGSKRARDGSAQRSKRKRTGNTDASSVLPRWAVEAGDIDLELSGGTLLVRNEHLVAADLAVAVVRRETEGAESRGRRGEEPG